MSAYSFPSAPSRRRALLVLKDFEYEKCRYSPGGSEILTDDEMHIVPTSVFDAGDLPVALQSINQRHIARPGALLVQSPFRPDHYEPLEAASETFAKEKYGLIDMFCQKLGARSLQIDEVAAETDQNKVSVDAKAKNNFFNFSGKTEFEKAKALRNELSSITSWTGGSVDLHGAEMILNDNGLQFDSTLKSLLNMRRGGDNTLLNKKIVISLSSETKSNLRVVGRLNIPQYVNVMVDYKSEVKKTASYSVSIDVKF